MLNSCQLLNFHTMPVLVRFWQVYDRMVDTAFAHVPQVMGAMLFVALTFVMSRMVRNAIRLAMQRTKADMHIRMLVAQCGYIGVWITGLTIALSLLDVNMSGILAGLSLTGAALSLAVRDIIANMVAGIVLLSTRPFKIGDSLVIEGFEGAVEAIEIRATTLKTHDGKQVLIPNAKVYAANITNLSAYQQRRGSLTVKVAAYQKSEAIYTVLREELASIPGVLSEPAPVVRLQDFSGDALTIEVGFWVDTRETSFMETQTLVKERLRSRLLAQRITLG